MLSIYLNCPGAGMVFGDEPQCLLTVVAAIHLVLITIFTNYEHISFPALNLPTTYRSKRAFLSSLSLLSRFRQLLARLHW